MKKAHRANYNLALWAFYLIHGGDYGTTALLRLL